MKTMKIKKGDTVHVLSGKDRGKQGRVIEARPKERRVLVENLNMIKRHTRPRPMAESEPDGPAAAPAGRRDREGVSDPALERDARLPDVQPADARRHRGPGIEERRGKPARARVQANRLS